MKPTKRRRKLTDPPPPKQLMTSSELQLSQIAGSRIEMVCPGCDHAGSLSVTDLMKIHGGAAYLVRILSKASCTSCGRSGAPAVTVHPRESKLDADEE